MIKRSFFNKYGPKEYNKFVSALFGPAKEKNRLMTWQSNVWVEFTEEFPEYPTDFIGILAAFENDSDSIEIDDGDFMSNPFEYFGRLDFSVSKAALRSAYAKNDFREYILYSISRSVSKTGDFHLCAYEVSQIKEIITDDEKRDLFKYIVENSGRASDEWLFSFNRLFSL